MTLCCSRRAGMALVALLWCHPAEAQPAITSMTGHLAHGNTIVISGSGFGTKTTPLPLVWTTFDGGTLHPQLTPHGNMIFNNADNLRHPFASFNARADFKNNPEAGQFFSYDKSVAPKWFVQYWIKLAPNWHWGVSTFLGPDDGLANIKIMRFFPEGDRNYSNVMYVITGFTGGFPIARTTENVLDSHGFGDARSIFSLDTWHSVQVEFAENTGVDQPDGKMKLWIDGTLLDETDTLITNAALDGPAVDKRPYGIGFFDSWPPSDAPVSNMYAYYSDIYVDNTWARIELGNASTYDACTRREVQLPTAWAEGRVIARVNQGSFVTGQTAYLYVSDANGQVNATGFPVVIGGGASEKPLTAPQGLHIAD